MTRGAGTGDFNQGMTMGMTWQVFVRALATSLILLLSCTSPSYAATIVKWDFSDNNNTVDVIAANVSSTTFDAGPGLIDVSFAGMAAARGWKPSTSAADAETRGDFWTFTVTANAGFQFDLVDLTLDEMVETDGPVMFQLWANGSPAGSAMSTSNGSFANHVIPLTGFDNLTSFAVRILAWNAHDNGDTADWFVDNVTLNGLVEQEVASQPSPVPEPASLLLVGAGAAGYALRRRRGL